MSGDDCCELRATRVGIAKADEGLRRDSRQKPSRVLEPPVVIGGGKVRNVCELVRGAVARRFANPECVEREQEEPGNERNDGEEQEPRSET